MLEITLPWFAAILGPNTSCHWNFKRKARASQKQDAFWITVEAMQKNRSFVPSKPVTLSIIFYPPNKRGRDLDNCLASIKAAIDGISMAIQINDKHFSYAGLSFGEIVKNGKIVIKIT